MGPTVPVYDISGDQPVLGDMPHDQVQAAVASGKFSFPKGQEVDVISPDGSLGTVPADKAPDALKNGFTYATPEIIGEHKETEKFTTPGQKVLAGIEGVANGVAGPLAPLAEVGLGADPEAIRKREEHNPWTHGVSEAGGFVGGMFTGASEASLLAKAGEAVSKGVEGASVASRLAAGAARMATEMGLFQAGDEASKAILQDPNQTVGSAASNVGLSALMGGAVGIPLAGIGIASKAGMNSQLLKDFSDRLAFRGSNLNPHELMEKEFNEAINTYHGMNDELLGPQGLKAKALENIMPSMSPEISQQAQTTADALQKKIDFMRNRPSAYPERLVSKLEDDLNNFKNKAFSSVEKSGPVQELAAEIPEIAQHEVSVTPIRFDENPAKNAFPWLKSEDVPPKLVRGETQRIQPELRNQNPSEAIRSTPIETVNPSPNEIFDAMNELKQSLQGYSKGNYGPFAIASHHEAYDFLNATKGLGHDVRNALEDSFVWKDAAKLQKEINKSWSDVLPAVKDAQGKFMEKVGGEYVPSPQKFSTYMNQSGKATSTTIRQKMMGNFVEGLQKHFDTIDKIYQSAGVENPYSKVSMNALRESLERPSSGSRLADLWFDKLGAKGLGNAAGAMVGGGIGAMTHLPEAGLGGAYLGKEILGPAFASIIPALMEKGPHVSALRGAMSYGKAVLTGEANLTKAAANVFGTEVKTLPAHLYPNEKSIQKLDKRLKEVAQNPEKMIDVASGFDHYMPSHAQAVSKTTMAAANYLNSIRPSNPKLSPLDSEIPASKEQEAMFNRALSVAEQPMLVLDHIKNATLLPQDVKTIKTVYPEYYDKISQKLMGSMTDHIAAGGTIPYKIRQSASMFLGQPLDSTMTPSSIQSIQAMYSKNKPTSQAQAPGSAKKGTSKLAKISTNMQTTDQARISRSINA